MQWSTIYLILAILAGGLGTWKLARNRNPFLGLIGILWFLIVLFKFYITGLFGFVVIRGIPTLGSLMEYALLPILLLFAYFYNRSRR